MFPGLNIKRQMVCLICFTKNIISNHHIPNLLFMYAAFRFQHVTSARCRRKLGL